MNIIIKNSSAPNKKYTAVIDNGKTSKSIHFGDNRYQDFTIHKNTERKKAYLARHKHDKSTNPLYAGFYSSNLLWNKPTLRESIKNTNDKYNVNIKLKI